MKEVLLSVKAVKSMHCLHLWALTLGQALVSVHLAIGSEHNNICLILTRTQTAIHLYLAVVLQPCYINLLR